LSLPNLLREISALLRARVRKIGFIVDGDICRYFDNKIHFPYIKKIFLGCKMNTHNIDILLEIAEELKIEIVLMQMNDRKFCLEPQSLDSYKWNRGRSKWKNPLFSK